MNEHQALPVPLHIRNAPTSLMKDLGYGAGYQYDHDADGNVAAQTYLPEELDGRQYYRPGPLGFEKEVARRMAYWEKLRRHAAGEDVEDEVDDSATEDNEATA